LKYFAVWDRQRELVGEVRDVIFDRDRQLKVIVAQPDPHQGLRLFLLSGQQIQTIDAATRSLFARLTTFEIDQLPTYVLPHNPQIRSYFDLQFWSGVSSPDLSSAPTPEVEATPAAQLFNSQSTPMPNDFSPSPSSMNPSLQDDLPMNQSAVNQTDSTDSDNSMMGQNSQEPPSMVEEAAVRLLEERLVVERDRRKVGEVVVRKEIEVRNVMVPVRREKLVVEQISPEYRQLAEVDLGQGELTGVELINGTSTAGESVVQGEFTSLKAASQLLAAVANQQPQKCQKVRVEIVVEDETARQTYQEWFERYQKTSS